MLHIAVFSIKNYYPNCPRSVDRLTSDQRGEEHVYIPSEDLCVGVEHGDNIRVTHMGATLWLQGVKCGWHASAMGLTCGTMRSNMRVRWR